jgi:predicted nucleotide-binding protein
MNEHTAIMIKNDIARCKATLKSKQGMLELYRELASKYEKIYPEIFKSNDALSTLLTVLNVETNLDRLVRMLESKLKTEPVEVIILSPQEQVLNDIRRCREYISLISVDEAEIKDYYRTLTAKYSNLIKNFGSNIYSYYPDMNFFDSNILVATIIGNLKVMVGRIEQYYHETYMSKDINHSTQRKNSSEAMENNVFIIHGHNEAKRRELCELLRTEFGLNPIVLSEQPESGISTIIEKFEKYARTCSYAFALFTPDDIVINKGKEYFQTRPNVIFELGWFVSHINRKNVCILNQSGYGTEIFSDLQGVLRKEFKDEIREKYIEIRDELRAARIIK